MDWINAHKMDYVTAVHTFYILQDLSALRVCGVSSVERRAQRKLLYDTNTYLKETFAPHMARTLRDYLVVASLGEARHAVNCSERYYCISDIPSKRSETYHLGQRYALDSLLNQLGIVFNDQKWNDGYGGTSWGTLVEKAAKHGTTSDSLFIDMVVNLTHNGGLCYDKDILVSNGSLIIVPFLDHRRYYDAISWGINCTLSIEEYVCDLLRTACRSRMVFIPRALNSSLPLEKKNINYNELCISKQMLSFPQISWGNEDLILLDRSNEDGYDREEEFDEAENYELHERSRERILEKR